MDYFKSIIISVIGLSYYFGFFDNVYSGLATVSVIGLSYYLGFLNNVAIWIEGKRQRGKLLLKLMEGFEKDISKKAPSGFTVCGTDESASILYERLGKEYIVWTPYNRSKIVSMSQFKVELLREGKQPLDITQQPGIPYTISAAMLGGDGILITNHETDVSHRYDRNEIPMYGDEVIN
jgi:hypothetical protein